MDPKGPIYIFCPTLIHVSKIKTKNPKKKEEEEKMCKITNFKAKKGQNKYNMIG